MKIYKISQNVNDGYDTYDSAVVCAESADEAKIINPGGYYKWKNGAWYFQYADKTESREEDPSWTTPDNVMVEEIGEANESQKKGVICASFHAG